MAYMSYIILRLVPVQMLTVSHSRNQILLGVLVEHFRVSFSMRKHTNTYAFEFSFDAKFNNVRALWFKHSLLI